MQPGAFTLTLSNDQLLTVAPGMTFQAFDAGPAAKLAAMNYWGGGINAKIEPCHLLARRVVIELTFTSNVLSRASIFVHLDNDGADWSQWTLEQEMARKREHDALALALFGVALTPKPMDIDGKPILPLELTAEYPNHAKFPWGEVVSGYDSKGGMAIMWIAYATEPPA